MRLNAIRYRGSLLWGILLLCLWASATPLSAQRLASEAISPQEVMQRLRESPHSFIIATLDERPVASASDVAPFHQFVSLEHDEQAATWTIYVDAERPYWLAYGACQALWETDLTYRELRRDAEALEIGVRRESECLVTMIESYLSLRTGQRLPEDALVERLRKKLLDGTLDKSLAQGQSVEPR